MAAWRWLGVWNLRAFLIAQSIGAAENVNTQDDKGPPLVPAGREGNTAVTRLMKRAGAR